jgi:hypothetical protein
MDIAMVYISFNPFFTESRYIVPFTLDFKNVASSDITGRTNHKFAFTNEGQTNKLSILPSSNL